MKMDVLKRYTEDQVIGFLKQAEAGRHEVIPAPEYIAGYMVNPANPKEREIGQNCCEFYSVGGVFAGGGGTVAQCDKLILGARLRSWLIKIIFVGKY